MRLTRWCPLIAALLLSGCDASVLQALGTLLEEDHDVRPTAKASLNPTAKPTPTPTPQPSARPTLPPETYPALDLSAETWVSEQPDAYRVEADTIRVLPRAIPGLHLFYRPPLGDTYTLSFSEPREVVTGDTTVRWTLDPADALKKDALGQTIPVAEETLALKANGNCQLVSGGQVVQERHIAGPRRWEIAVEPGRTTVTLNGEAFASYERVAGYHPAPWLALWTRVSKPGTMSFENVKVTSNAPTERHAVLRQWSMAGKGVGVDRFNFLYANDLPDVAPSAELDAMPPMLTHVVAVGGFPLFRTEAIVYARTDGFGGGTHGGSGCYVAARHCKGSAVLAHEIAHGYNAAGSLRGRSGEGWLVEGFADYVCFMAENRYKGRPLWLTAPIANTGADADPPLSESNDQTTATYGGQAVAWKIYVKGRIFFALLAAHTSVEDVRAVVVAVKDVEKVTGEQFVQQLEARTGKDLSALRPGWLVAGAYQGVSPADAVDTDKDGLLDLQEIVWKTDPKRADTDGDGITDADELAAGTDPRTAEAALPGPKAK